MDALTARLAGLDPVPEPMDAPPIEPLLARLDAPQPSQQSRVIAGAGDKRRSRLRWSIAQLPLVLAAGVVVAIVGLALTLTHRGVAPTPPAGQTPPSASGPPAFPHLSVRQRKQIDYVMKADGTTGRHDPACAPAPATSGGPGRKPSLSSGSPSAAILAGIGTLRRSPTSADRLPPRILGPSIPPHVYPFGTYPPVGGIYARYIRYARHRDGANFYLVPAENVNQTLPVPARCYSEQITALGHERHAIPPRLRAGIFALQAVYLNYERARTRPYPGVCLSALNATGNGDGASCFALTTIDSGHTLTSGAPAGVPVVYGLAPDGVANVTFHYRGHRHLTALVLHNVFILHNPRQRLPNYGFPTTLTWHAPDGHTIKTIRFS